MNRCRESQGWTTACTVVCPNVAGRTKERIAQSKRARAGSLALIDKPQVARTCILRVFGLKIDVMIDVFPVKIVLFCFVFVFILYAFIEAAALRSTLLSLFDMQAAR